MWKHRRGKEKESRSSLIQEREGRCGRSLMPIDTPGDTGEGRGEGERGFGDSNIHIHTIRHTGRHF